MLCQTMLCCILYYKIQQNQFHIQRNQNCRMSISRNEVSRKHTQIDIDIKNQDQFLPLQSKVLKLQEELQALKKMKLRNTNSVNSRNNSAIKPKYIQEEQMKKIQKQKQIKMQQQRQRQRQRLKERQKRIIQKELEKQMNVKNAKVKDLIVEIKSNDTRMKSKYSKSQLKQKSEKDYETSFNEISKRKNVSQLCKNLQTVSKQNPRKKKIKINLTQLKDQNNQVHSNIFNVAIAQIMNTEQQRKLTMIQQIKTLKSKLQRLKQKSQSKIQSESNNYQAFDLKSSIQNWPLPTTALNRSMKGKLYRKSEFKSLQKSIQAKMDSNSLIKNVQLKKNTNKLAWNPQMNLKINLNQKSQSFIRSGEQSSGRIYNTSSFRGKSAVPTTSRTSMDLNKPFQKSFKRRAQSNDKYATISESNNKKFDFQYENQTNQVQIINRVLTPQENYLNINQPPAQFLQNFRQYIKKKVSMPKLPQTPTPYDQHSDLQTLGKVVFALFDVFVDEQIQENKNYEYKVIKYKNCILFQLCPQKNIVWYYDKKFYFGGWDINIYGQGRKQGFGLDYIPDEYIYRGYFSNSKRKGYGIMINHYKADQQKNLIYEGEWNQGIKEGVGYQIDQQSEYIGQFKEGIRDGCGKVKTKTSLYEGDIVKNIKQGKGYEKLINGDEYYGQFKNNRFHGKGEYKWKTSAYYNGTFKDGLRHGTGVWISNLNKQNFDTYKGAYEENKKNGYGVYKWSNGAIYEGYFKNDLRHDQGLMKYPNGKAAKFMWKEGNIAKKIYSAEEEQYRKNRAKKRNQNQLCQQVDSEQASNSQHHLTFMSGMKINLQNAVYSQFDRQSSYFFNTAKQRMIDFQSQRL